MFSMALLCLSQLVLLVGSVSYGPTFPSPLSKEEEKETIARMMEGDQEAKHSLITHNLRLVAHICKKYAVNGRDLDDLISIGSIGLIKAVNTFDPERGRPIGSYAARCIENEILMYLRKTQSQKNEISIDEPLNIDWDGNELLLSDILGTDSDTVNRNIENQVERNLLLEAVAKLGERERIIMELRFGLGGKSEHTQKEVADIIGISQSYISRLEKRIMKWLKAELEKTAV